MSIYLYFHNLLHFALVCILCMLLRIASVRWFCEVPSINVLRTPPPPTLTPQKERKTCGGWGGAEEDTYLNFMTKNCQFYSHKIALIA